MNNERGVVSYEFYFCGDHLYYFAPILFSHPVALLGPGVRANCCLCARNARGTVRVEVDEETLAKRLRALGLA